MKNKFQIVVFSSIFLSLYPRNGFKTKKTMKHINTYVFLINYFIWPNRKDKEGSQVCFSLPIGANKIVQ